MNTTESEDAAQDVFVKAYQALPKFHAESSFLTWICRIAYNHCMDVLRKKTRQKTDSWDAMLEEEQEKVYPLLSKTGEKGSSSERSEWIGSVLSSLRPEYREILVLREVEDLSYEEIASILRCTLNAVKARLRRARREMQEKARHFLKLETSHE